MVVCELLPAVLMTLQAMVSPQQFQDLGSDWNWDSDTLTKANGFLYQLQSPLFLLSFKILLEVLTCLRGLTLKLQMEAIDVLYAYKEVCSIVSMLRSMSSESKEGFSRMFGETSRLGRDLHGHDFELTKLRINRQQTQRSNVQASTAEQYYRITLYNESLSHVITELEECFVKSPPHYIGLLHLLLRECSSTTKDTTGTTTTCQKILQKQ